MGGTVTIRNVIGLAGQGPVVIGRIASGAVRAGQRTAPLPLRAGERSLEVRFVQRLHSADGTGEAVGLGFVQPPPVEEMQQLLPAGSVLELHDA